MNRTVAPWEGHDGKREWWGRDNMALVDDLSGGERWWQARDGLGRTVWMAAVDELAGDGTLWNLFRRTQPNPQARAALDEHDAVGASVLAHVLRATPPPRDSIDFAQQSAWLQLLRDGQQALQNPQGEGVLMQLHRLSERADTPGRWCLDGPPLNVDRNTYRGAHCWVAGLTEEAVCQWLSQGALQHNQPTQGAHGKLDPNPRLLCDWLVAQYQKQPAGDWGAFMRAALDLAVALERIERMGYSMGTSRPEQGDAWLSIIEPQLRALVAFMPTDGTDLVSHTLSWPRGLAWWQARQRDLLAMRLSDDTMVATRPNTVRGRL